MEPLAWNFAILVWASAVGGFISETGERWLGMQTMFYIGLFLSVAFWTIVAAVKVAMAT